MTRTRVYRPIIPAAPLVVRFDTTEFYLALKFPPKKSRGQTSPRPLIRPSLPRGSPPPALYRENITNRDARARAQTRSNTTSETIRSSASPIRIGAKCRDSRLTALPNWSTEQCRRIVTFVAWHRARGRVSVLPQRSLSAVRSAPRHGYRSARDREGGREREKERIMRV